MKAPTIQRGLICMQESEYKRIMDELTANVTLIASLEEQISTLQDDLQAANDECQALNDDLDGYRT